MLRLIKPNFNGTIWRKIPMEALYSIPFWFRVFLINLAAIFSCFVLKYSVLVLLILKHQTKDVILVIDSKLIDFKW